jgi:hypothetical protein
MQGIIVAPNADGWALDLEKDQLVHMLELEAGSGSDIAYTQT